MTPRLTPEKPETALDEIRERHQKHVSANFPEPGICVSRDGSWPCDAGRLLAAVDEALRLHVRQDRPVRTRHLCMQHSGLGGVRADRSEVDACPYCTVTEKYVCTHCRHECPDNDAWPCPTVQAVTRVDSHGSRSVSPTT